MERKYKNEKSEKKYVTGNDLEGVMKLSEAIPLGLQHVLAMFAGNLTPILIICGVCGIAVDSSLQVTIIQNAMLVAGIVTLVQIFTIGPIGARLPIVMGTCSGFVSVMSKVANTMGGGIFAYGAILGASVVGGIFELVLGFFLKPLRKIFSPVVTGVVILSMGLILIPVGINFLCGGFDALDFGSVENIFVGIFVLVVIIVLKHKTKGITSSASILFGIIAGYVLVVIMGMIIPTTFKTMDADINIKMLTKSWVLQWDKIKEVPVFAVPKFLPVPLVFDFRAIIPMMIMFVVTAVETIGDISGITFGGLGREATDKELSGGVMCDGIGSSFAALFGVTPNTSFSQNVGLIGMTKVVNLFAISIGAGFLVLCGLFPKIAAIISIMPAPVLGGAAILMFASIMLSGIKLIAKNGITEREVTIVSVAIGLGYGLGTVEGALNQLPEFVSLFFGNSGMVPATIIAIVLNILIPEKK